MSNKIDSLEIKIEENESEYESDSKIIHLMMKMNL